MKFITIIHKCKQSREAPSFQEDTSQHIHPAMGEYAGMLPCSEKQKKPVTSSSLQDSGCQMFEFMTVQLEELRARVWKALPFFCKKLYKAQDELHLLIFVWNHSAQKVVSHATFMKSAYQPILFLFLFYVSKSDSFGNNSLVRSAYCPAPVFQSKETRFSPGEAVKAEVTMCL